MRLYFTVIAAVLFLHSCFAQKSNVSLSGCWLNKSINESTPDYMSLRLNEDMTFISFISMDILGSANVSGTWKVNNDTLTLKINMPKQEAVKQNNVQEHITDGEQKIIKVISQDTIPLVGAEVIINDIDTLFADIDGIVLTNIERVNKIRVKDFTLKEGIVYYPKNVEANLFNIYTYYSKGVPAIYLSIPSKWIIKGKTISTPYKEGESQEILKKVGIKKCAG